MKKRLLIALLMVAIAVCLFAISISAAPQNYQSYEVELVNGEKITVYETQCWDQWQGHIHLTDVTYTEAPVDTEGTYQTLDWSQVKVVDFTNAWGHRYNETTGEYDLKVGTNDGYSLHISSVSFTPANATSLEKFISGKATLLCGGKFCNLPALKELVVDNNVKEIAWNAFSNCTALTTVTIKEGSNLKNIGQQAFWGCSSLTNIKLPDTVTGMGNNIFDSCTSLKSINWPSQMATIPSGTFNGCTSLVFEIPSNITTIGGSAFKNCDSLVSVTIPDSVTNLGGAFGYCDNLESIVISDNSLVSNKLIGLAEYCPKLTSIRIPPLVTELGYDNFRGCSSLSKVIWPNNLTTISGNQNFTNCAFTSFTFPNSLTTLGGGNLTGSPIEEIRLGNSLTNLDDGIFTFKTLKRVYIPASVTEVGARLLGWTNSADSSYNITFIFTGTKEQAVVLQETLEANQNTDHAPNNSKFYDAILVSASEFDVTQEPNGYHLVYDFSACDAFFNGVHKLSENYKLNFVDFTSSFNEISECTVCGKQETVNENDYAPIFSGYKLSVKEKGYALCVSYSINNESMKVYNKYSDGSALSYGAVASKGLNDGETLLSLDNGNVIKGKESAVIVNLDTEYAGFDFVLRGFNESHENVKLIINAYVCDGENIYYISSKTNDKPVEITMAEAKSLG